MTAPEDTSLVGALYDAALDPARWPATLQCLAASFGGHYAHVGTRYYADRRLDFFHQVGIEPGVAAAIVDDFVALAADDPLEPDSYGRPDHPARHNGLSTPTRLDAIRAGAAFHCREILTDAEIHRVPMHRRVRVRVGLEYCLVKHVCNDGARVGSYAVSRGPDCQPFTRADCARLDRLQPHLERALLLYERLHRLDYERRSGLQVLEDATLPLLVTRANATVLFANRAARDWLSAGEGLTLLDGRLAAGDGAVEAQLRAALTTVTGDGDANGTPVSLGQDPAAPTCWVTALRLAPASSTMDAQAPLAVLLLPPSSSVAAADPQDYAAAFDLTPAQARVLAALVAGDDVATIGERFDIGPATVRTHLKALFRATGTRDQAALVRTALGTGRSGAGDG
ncbi:MAG: helix-turn-helix transcriptional regulator [Gammaproteobacteria bacterium]|nr:helix-turn-helix transcriptional regulator [Gammaproteobacteria bacterium]